MAERDWASWHDAYDDPRSVLSRRLAIVQGIFVASLDEAPRGEIRVVSMCAGQGRDVIEVLASHPRKADVKARLVELDERNVQFAKRSAEGIAGVEVVQGDASLTSSYSGAVPARVVLACGIFGNITDRAIEETISELPMFCERDAVVIWTRHRLPPDITPQIREWFENCDFEEIAFEGSDENFPIAVGAHRFSGRPRPLEEGKTIFTFDDSVAGRHFPGN
jgi:hypothetical protein